MNPTVYANIKFLKTYLAGLKIESDSENKIGVRNNVYHLNYVKAIDTIDEYISEKESITPNSLKVYLNQEINQIRKAITPVTDGMRYTFDELRGQYKAFRDVLDYMVYLQNPNKDEETQVIDKGKWDKENSFVDMELCEVIWDILKFLDIADESDNHPGFKWFENIGQRDKKAISVILKRRTGIDIPNIVDLDLTQFPTVREFAIYIVNTYLK